MTDSTFKKGLFILHEGIGSTIFNSQVFEHSKGMRDLGFEIDILAFDTFSKTWELSNTNLLKFKKNCPHINIVLKKAINIYLPFSLVYNLIILIKFFKNNKKKYSFIQARADYSTFLCILSKPFHKLPVLWDCRGDSVSELIDSLSRKNIFIRLIGHLYLVSFDRLVVYINSKKSDGAIFVSESLYKLFKKTLSTSIYQVIPCPVSEKIFFFDEHLRLDMRNKFNISNEKIVYLYSGSMVAYQSLHEQYNQYKDLLKNPDSIIIIATSQPDFAKFFFKELLCERFFVTSVDFEDMNSYYNLADFSFLMREKKQLNFVASPTKFGEYCLTGLPVIMNDTVDQAYVVSKTLGNYVSSIYLSNRKLTNNQREHVSIKAKDFYSREVLNSKYYLLFSAV
jgi:hypothetical protein